MNFGELLTEIRVKIDDTKKTRFTDEALRLLVNQARRDIYRELVRAKVYTKTTTTTISFVSGTQEVALPDDFLKILEVRDDWENRIPVVDEAVAKEAQIRSVYVLRKTVSEPKRTTKSTTNDAYLGWYRIPASSFDANVKYIQTISIYENLDTTSSRHLNQGLDSTEELHDLPLDADNVVTSRVAMLAHGVDEDNSKFWAGEYAQGLLGLIELLRPENFENTEVVDVRSDYAGYFDQ